MRAMNKFLLVLSLGIRYTRPIFVYVGCSRSRIFTTGRLYGCRGAFLGHEFSAKTIMSISGGRARGYRARVFLLYINRAAFSRDTRYGYRNFSYSLSRVWNNFMRYAVKFVSPSISYVRL